MPLIESAIGGIAGSIIDKAIAVGQYAVKEVKGAYRDVDHKQQLIAAIARYPDEYHRQHCQIKTLKDLMPESRNLEEFYTEVKLLSERGLRAFSGDNIEETYRAKGKRSLGVDDGKRRDGMTIFNQKQCLMVLGGPGIGKSTFLRKIGLETLKKDGAVEWEGIPVFLELKTFREATLDIKQKIIEKLDIFQFPEAESFVDAALAQGKLMVLFDGLDEVPAERLDLVIEKIESFVDKHARPIDNSPTAEAPTQNRFVASCRTAAYRSSFRRFTDVTIAEFSNTQIQQFIRRWFSSSEDEAIGMADELLKLLNQTEHSATMELAKTPLLLTFLCLVYDCDQALPSQRSALYERALDIILIKWDTQRRIKRKAIYKGFHVGLEKQMLAEIAYDSFCQDQLFFAKEMLTGQIIDFLSNTLGAPKTINATEILDEIEAQQGILVERVSNTYSFSHLTLQEYLTASYVVGKRLEEKLVKNHLVSDRWREIFLLAAGESQSPVTQLFTLMETQSRVYLEEFPKLKQLINWAATSGKLSERAVMLAITIANAFTSNISSTSDSVFASTSTIASNSTSISAIAKAVASVKASDSANATAKAFVFANTAVRTNGGARAKDSISANVSVSANALASVSTDHLFSSSKTFGLIAENLSKHKQLIPSESDSSRAWKSWGERLQMIWLDALGLDRAALTFSFQELEALCKYLDANALIVECKASAIRVPCNEWKALEKKMLTLDD